MKEVGLGVKPVVAHAKLVPQPGAARGAGAARQGRAGHNQAVQPNWLRKGQRMQALRTRQAEHATRCMA